MSLTVVERVILLQNVEVFTNVPTEPLSHLAAIASEVTFLQGDHIYDLGDESDSLYVVVGGEVRLHRDGETITIARHSEAFGTWALVDDEPRVATATAETDARLLRVDKDDFLEVLAEHSDITQGVFKTLVGRMRRLLGRLGSDSRPR